MELSENAEKIFRMKYAQETKNGSLENWEQACVRVAHYISTAETSESNHLQMLADFTKIIYDQSFLPGGRILANAGTNVKNLMNCFVVPIDDSRDSIYNALNIAAQIFAQGGGVGYNFSNLREKGSPVMGINGIASGPLSFMELFNQTGEVISQASRRGAQMGIMDINHPDIEEFVNYKNRLNQRNWDTYTNIKDGIPSNDERRKILSYIRKTISDTQLSHFNLSVGIYDGFMEAVKNEDVYYLRSRYSSDLTEFDSKEMFYLIARSAWQSGDPGLFFISRANLDNVVPYIGKIESTNPCGEVPLLPYEACCLGSINLTKFIDGDYIDFSYLKDVIHYAVRFLDNVITLTFTPVDQINQRILETRRLGLGVMGWADVLAEMEIPYDHEDAFTLASVLAKTIQTEAWKASMSLAKERGAFPAFLPEQVNWKLIDDLKLKRMPLRNVAVTSIAPTGSIALLCDVNSGIEPFFAHSYKRNITHGIGTKARDSIFQESYNNDIKTAHQIHWKDHIRMQAAWQDWVDNAVSKTINMPNRSSIQDVMDAYIYAWELGCKGITIYRNGSRNFQILDTEVK